MNIRIGIDVGGTFTDAVAVNESFELIGSEKIPTTHDAKEGVAAGIVEVLEIIMKKNNIKAADVTFIAHGTTQATNALLEGDVAKVGIISMGSGVQGIKTKRDTTIGDIELAPGKFLKTVNEFINTSDKNALENSIVDAINKLTTEGSESIVATEAFSVDNPENENAVIGKCAAFNIPSTASNEVSKLYGLRVRTRTAVINASILPKMLEVATMTEESIKNAKIEAPLMVMRCDGGVMTVDEVRKRPIMTILSGPAAGVAGALMYEKLTDGIFFEVGGTSTDISCVKDGNVMVKYAEVGGHKTYLNSLDVRTVGIGGGSMIRIDNGCATSVGPRSAHIANLEYEVYAKTEDIENPVLKSVRPMTNDPEYASIECSNGNKYALTLSGAANICGYVKKDDYAYGNIEAAKKAWEPLAKSMGLSIEDVARKVLELSTEKNGIVVKSIIKDYNLDPKELVFVGGGGGATTVVPHIAEIFGCKHKIAKNAEVISPIGVALAMVRDVVERTILNPTEEDILNVRQEAIQMAMKSGASHESIEVKIEVDTQLNKVRATAIGTTELRAKDLNGTKLSKNELKEIAANSIGVDKEKIRISADNDTMIAFTTELLTKHNIFFKKKVYPVRLVDKDGVIRLQRKNADVRQCTLKNWESTIKDLLQEHTVFGDGGEEIPNIYIVVGSKIIDLSSMQSKKQIFALCSIELAGVIPSEKLIAICTKTTENQRG